jgi:hypothetical protein
MRLYGLCPDAPGFFNLFPGFWTGDHPPRKYYTHAFQRSRIFLIEMPAKYAKRQEYDFVYFVFFVGKSKLL